MIQVHITVLVVRLGNAAFKLIEDPTLLRFVSRGRILTEEIARTDFILDAFVNSQGGGDTDADSSDADFDDESRAKFAASESRRTNKSG